MCVMRIKKISKYRIFSNKRPALPQMVKKNML